MRDNTGTDRRPWQTEMQTEDQYRVHHCGGEGSEKRDIHRTPCIANGA